MVGIRKWNRNTGHAVLLDHKMSTKTGRNSMSCCMYFNYYCVNYIYIWQGHCNMGFPCLVNLEYSWALAVHLCLFVSATTLVLWLCLINNSFTIIFVCLVGPGSSYWVNWELGTSQSCLPLPGLGSSHRESWELGDSQSYLWFHHIYLV